MVGAAVCRALLRRGHDQVLVRTHAELDLTSQVEVGEFLQTVRPAWVVIAAAKVGGIRANERYPAEFIYENTMIAANLIYQAWRSGVDRLLFLGSSCIYPRDASQPMSEEVLLSGHLEPTNEPYSIAKIAGIKLCESFNRQYGTDFRCVMPCNLYGPGDQYHPENSHVIPGLIRRFHEAKVSGSNSVAVWGTGNPRREFLFVDDLADAIVTVMEVERDTFAHQIAPMCSHINVGAGRDLTIRELAEEIRIVVGFRSEERRVGKECRL